MRLRTFAQHLLQRRRTTMLLQQVAKGFVRPLETEAMQHSDLKFPRRVHDLEEEIYGPGRSKHPKHARSDLERQRLA